ncbi:MAG: N-acetylmuramoyl-L-alanine amidase [Oricola sp.]|nr:N-acetylmuramoyl-L-alanine amidase [Oricola sp.]
MSITLICIHCSATKPSQDIGAAEIDSWHRQRDWAMIGYNDVIRRDGRLEPGRPWGAALAHAKGFNEGAIAVCMVGGISETGEPEANFTPAQWKTLDAYLAFAKLRYPDADIKGHRDLNGVNKACPSFSVARYLQTGEVVA